MSRSILTRIFVVSILAAFVSPVFAVGSLGVTGYNMAPAYINTNTSTAVLNLSMNATVGIVNITAIQVGFNGTATSNNISAVEIYNNTLEAANLIGNTNTINTTTNTTNVTLSSVFYLNVTSNATFIIAIKVSNLGTRFSNIIVNLTSNESISTQGNGNISFTSASGWINSSAMQIQDLHANASLSPSYADTNVFNQTFIYNITKTGDDRISEIIITVPSGFNITNVTNVTGDGADCIPSAGCVVNGLSPINITIPTSDYQSIRIYFTVNTSSPVDSVAFNSTITMTDGNLTGITTDVVNTSTRVEVKQLINVDSAVASKNSAYVNGSDYWEFNFTLNITANVSGLVNFKMENWLNTDGITLNITNDTAYTNVTEYYASLREDGAFSTSNKFNVTTFYNASRGVSITATENNVYYVVLRMIIPKYTIVSSTWYTTYKMLFRTSP